MASWTSASAFVFLRHPIPGSNGVLSLASIVTYAQNRAPDTDAVYIAYNKGRSMLMLLYVRSDGRYSFTKEYATRKQQFDIIKLIAHNARSKQVTKADVERVIKVLTAPETP